MTLDLHSDFIEALRNRALASYFMLQIGRLSLMQPEKSEAPVHSFHGIHSSRRN